MIVDEAVRRGEWSLGRVEQTEKIDQHVRRAWVRRADGKVILRDRTKLVHLEINEKDNRIQ